MSHFKTFSLKEAKNLIFVSYLMTALALFGILRYHLLSTLISGLLVHQLIILMATKTRLSRLGRPKARFFSMVIMSILIIAAILGIIFAIVSVFYGEHNAIPMVMQKAGEVAGTLNEYFPSWLVGQFPKNADAWQLAIMEWAKEHSGELQFFGGKAGRSIIHILFGLVIGAMIALYSLTEMPKLTPLPRVLSQRMTRLSLAFHEIVFSQVKISAINALFTWIYLDGILRILGYHLPLTKTLIVLTFLFGLLPIVGNLITNTLIVIISITHSLYLGVVSLIFLVVIHKLEYFLNAKIIGSRIKARTWELLIAMVAMEALFGIPGVIAAPIYYAYLKNELKAAKLI